MSSLTSFKAANDRFATAVSGLTPPASAKFQQDAVVSQLRQLSDDLDQARTAVSHTDASALASADAKVQSDTQRLLSAVRLLGAAVRGSGSSAASSSAASRTALATATAGYNAALHRFSTRVQRDAQARSLGATKARRLAVPRLGVQF